MKALLIAVIAFASLTGCIAVPVYPDGAYYSAPGYYPGPAAGVYVAPPTVYFGGGYGYRGGYGGGYGYRRGYGGHWR